MSAPLTSLDRPNSYIGRSVPRPNAKRLLAGRGRYVSDLRLPRMLYAAFLRSPYAHAKIVAIDTEQAGALEGVHLVATGADLAKICTPWTGTLDHFKGMTSTPQLPLPLDRVVWAGQAVVAVVAESRAIAEDALELIEVDYEDLPSGRRHRRRAPGRRSADQSRQRQQRLLPQPARQRHRRRRLCARRPCGGRGILLRPPHRGDAGAARHRRRLRSVRWHAHRASRDADAVSSSRTSIRVTTASPRPAFA